MSHKRQKVEEKQVNSKLAAPKSQSNSNKEKFAPITQEHTNKKIHLKEKDERIEQNEDSITCEGSNNFSAPLDAVKVLIFNLN